MFIDTEQLTAELLLVAENDGKAYRDCRDVGAAIHRASVDALRQFHEELREARAIAAVLLKAQWTEIDNESK